MTGPADEETPQVVVFQPWPLRIDIGVVLLVVICTLLDSVPGGPRNGWGAVVHIVGFVSCSTVVDRSVTLRLGEQAVDIRPGWRKEWIPYEQSTEMGVGPRTVWWRIGRRRLDAGSTDHLMGGPSVRFNTQKMSVVVAAEEPYRVVGAMQRRMEPVAECREARSRQGDGAAEPAPPQGRTTR